MSPKPTTHFVATDPSQPVTIEIATRTPHGVKHAMWFAPPGATAWTALGRGDETGSYKIEPPVPDDSQVLVWTNLAGEKEQYEFSVTVSQSGRVLDGGDVTERGRVSEDNAASVMTHVVLD